MQKENFKKKALGVMSAEVSTKAEVGPALRSLGVVGPMLAKTGSEKDLDNAHFIFEPKLDGIRILCHIDKTMNLYTRTGRNVTKQFPEVTAQRCVSSKTSCILDGEMIVYNKKGTPDFNLIQGRYQLENEKEISELSHTLPATLVIFDILQKNHTSVCDKPLLERKKILAKIFKPTDTIQLIPYTDDGKKLYRMMKELGVEGVMGKDDTSAYYPGQRVDTWLKIKFIQTVDCVIIGYEQKKRLISALALGLYDKKKLIYIGKVGTGFSEDDIQMLYEAIKKNPKKNAPTNAHNVSSITWISPTLVCEIKYQEITRGKHLRKPVFIRLRTDKKAADCTVSSI